MTGFYDFTIKENVYEASLNVLEGKAEGIAILNHASEIELPRVF